MFLILIDKKLYTLKKLQKDYDNFRAGGQLDIYNSKFVDWNTGSLGHSIGVSIGLAIQNPNKKIYVIVGDAEFEELYGKQFFISLKKDK